MARAGYGARGLVYLIIGFFAVVAGFGAGEEVGARGALGKLLSQPLGTGLVWAMIVGLVGYVVWRLVQALLDTDDHGLDPRGLTVRAGLLISALAYSALAVYAVSLARGVPRSGGDGGGAGAEIASMFESIVGAQWVSLGFALAFAALAVAHWWKAAARKYAPHFKAGPRAMMLIHPVSIAGLAARGFVFAVLSLLAFYRFLAAGGGTGTSPGLEEALSFVQGLPFGTALLTAIGVGLIAFAAYSFAEARWRRINVGQAG